MSTTRLSLPQPSSDFRGRIESELHSAASFRGLSQFASLQFAQRRGRSGLRGCHSCSHRRHLNLGSRILDGMASLTYTMVRTL